MKRVVFLILSLGIVIAAISFATVAQAEDTVTVKHAFTNASGGLYNPESPLVLRTQDTSFYGSTFSGGANNTGGVYRITPSGTYTMIWSAPTGQGGAPSGQLALDSAGNIYLTTIGTGNGSITELTLSGGTWTGTILHTFGGSGDGHGPRGLSLDQDGNVFATTYYGGSGGCGVVSEYAVDGTYSVLHAFAGGSDGCSPSSAPSIINIGLQGRTTYLAGATIQAGANGGGTVYSISITSGTPTYTVLTSFASSNGDGGAPTGGLLIAFIPGVTHASPIQLSKLELIGTTSGGINGSGDGTVFVLSPVPPYTLITIYTNLNDGWLGGTPTGDPATTLYVVTNDYFGEFTHTEGVALSLTLNTGGMYDAALLYDFFAHGAVSGGNINGVLPYQSVLFGTAEFGDKTLCTNGCGTVFKLTP